MKIKCPDGSVKTIDWCRQCGKCLPKPIKDSLLHGRERETKPREKPRFGVTKVVANCLRSAYYDMTEEEIQDLEKLWVFSRGHAIHEFITRTLGEEEKEIFVEKKFKHFDLIGFVDAIHKDIIYEFKTTTNIPEKPSESHVLQGQAYYSMLPKEQQEKISKILVVYISLNKIKQFEVPIRDITNFLEEQGNMLSAALKMKIPPNKELSWLCNYCSHQDICDKNGEYEVHNGNGNSKEDTKQSKITQE